MYENNILKDIENIHTLYITAHINPDGDAVGSTFAFAQCMKALGKEPVILLEKYDDKFNSLSGKEFVFNGDYANINPEIIFAIDCGSKERLGKATEVFDRAKITYNIDHHISNTNFAHNNIVNGYASSASEIVYEII
ncbi:MAG: bifunctional oligoribonuclease/PAP phosphatase NrnA, partial [Lachnospirales bacterium]